MSFDKIFDLTAGVYFIFCNIYLALARRNVGRVARAIVLDGVFSVGEVLS